jgi:glycosyltransferase involved in cell wall biosynthesis
MVYAARLGSRPATVAVKYLLQSIWTARILRRERPDVIFVMTPPVFAALPAFWYAWRRGKHVVLDAHTGAFVLRRWRAFQWLQRWLCRRAATTLVSNEHLADLVRAAGAHATLVPDVPIVFGEKKPFPRPRTFTVAAVCSFDQDEPIEAMFEAASQLPDVQFFVTGNAKNLPAETAARRPPNVTLTGYLTVAEYGGLLSDVDAVLVLTTLDHTMQRGAYEAIYQGTPVIVSDWPILRDAFPTGAVHVVNTPDHIAAGVRAIQKNVEAYRSGARRLREAKLACWNATKEAIVARIGGPPSL